MGTIPALLRGIAALRCLRDHAGIKILDIDDAEAELTALARNLMAAGAPNSKSPAIFRDLTPVALAKRP